MELTSNKHFLDNQEPGTAWQKSTVRAKAGLQKLERKLLVTSTNRGKPGSSGFAVVTVRQSLHGQGSLVTHLQRLACSLPAPSCVRLPLGTSYQQHILVTICEVEIITPLVCMVVNAFQQRSSLFLFTNCM